MEQRYQLSGHVLVSPPQIIDRRFQNTVILLASNTPAGSWGLVINKPMMGITMQDVCQRIGIDWQGKDEVFAGGPIDPHGLHIIHTGDMTTTASQQVGSNLYVTSDISFLQAMSQGTRPRQVRFTLGVCTWAPDQLEGEQSGLPPWTPEHRWLTAPGDEELVFSLESEDQWQAAIDHCARHRVKDWML